MKYLNAFFYAIIFMVICTLSCLRAKQTASEQSPQDAISNVHTFLERTINKNEVQTVYMLFIIFLAGVLTSFTPCIYPMIPITIGILQAQARRSLLYNFFSSLSYVLGIALVYSVLGYISAKTSVIFGQWLGNPFFIIFIVLFFLYFALSLFGLYEIYIPAILKRNRDLPQDQRGTLLHSFMFGIISGTVASPCLTPALALVLGIAAKTANPLLGFLYLFMFSLGMGVLLILVGTFSSTVSLLPQSGPWMDEVKKVFGFVMLAVCVYFLEVFIPKNIALEFYSLIIFFASIYYFVSARGSKIKILIGLLTMIAAAILLATAIKLTFPR